MTEIKMDPGLCIDLLSTMQKIQSPLQDNIRNMMAKTNQLVTIDWIAGSANEFLREYTALDTRMRGLSSGLEGLCKQLKKAIDLHEKVDSGFG